MAKSEFNKNVLLLASGTAFAQALPIVISPILTRIYTPSDFGTLSLFIAIVSIFASIANGRYELAIMLPKKDENAVERKRLEVGAALHEVNSLQKLFARRKFGSTNHSTLLNKF